MTPARSPAMQIVTSRFHKNQPFHQEPKHLKKLQVTFGLTPLLQIPEYLLIIRNHSFREFAVSLRYTLPDHRPYERNILPLPFGIHCGQTKQPVGLTPLRSNEPSEKSLHKLSSFRN